jgi:FMN-dependent oxidoreductase (nitrilotriacetate monooxygenase family)
MSKSNRQMHLNLFMMSIGHHEAAWRHPETHPEDVTDLRHFQRLARTAERAKLDSLFLADGLATWGRVGHSMTGGLEPFTLLSALAASTERIGLIGTVSTTYNEPFHVARKFASLDHLSNGRAGWNIVTSGSEIEALNFGREEHLEHALRYERASEFIQVATKLWDSWDDDARLADKASGVYADVNKIREIDHRGEWFGANDAAAYPADAPNQLKAQAAEQNFPFPVLYDESQAKPERERDALFAFLQLQKQFLNNKGESYDSHHYQLGTRHTRQTSDEQSGRNI